VTCPALTLSSSTPPRLARRRGFSLVEVLVALGISGLVLTVVAAQLIESSKLSLNVSQTLEHSRNAREIIDALSTDVRASQILRIFPNFNDRSSEARDGQSGNYLVLQTIDSSGTVTRTVGYYVVSLGDNKGWALFRHDSQLGDNAAGTLPDVSAAGSHRKIKRAVRLSEAGFLFRSVRDRGVAIHGEFSTPDKSGSGRTEFIRCTISTRS
jgi:prepilin-type N-terminal cleavage/methylation domain-containing protein